VKPVCLYRTSIRRKLYLIFLEIEQEGAHAVRDGSGDVTMQDPIYTQFTANRGSAQRKDVHSRILIFMQNESDYVNNSYQWRS